MINIVTMLLCNIYVCEDFKGHLGCVPWPAADFCPMFNQEMSTTHYMSVCSISSEVPCGCAEDDMFEPSDCCTIKGKQDMSEMCNGEGV